MKGREQKLPVVILSRTNYGEADLIITFLSREHGKMSGLAKHGRKSRKRFGNIFSSPALVELTFTSAPGRDLVYLERGDILKSFEVPAGEIKALALVGYGLELVDGLTAPGDQAPEIFDLLAWFLERLAPVEKMMEEAFIFQVRLLKAAGFGPSLARCGVCGREVSDMDSPALSPALGGLACRPCAPSGFPVTHGSLKLMALIQSLDLGKVGRARVSARVIEEVQPFLRAYITYILNRELKSVRFMDQALGKGVI